MRLGGSLLSLLLLLDLCGEYLLLCWITKEGRGKKGLKQHYATILPLKTAALKSFWWSTVGGTAPLSSPTPSTKHVILHSVEQVRTPSPSRNNTLCNSFIRSILYRLSTQKHVFNSRNTVLMTWSCVQSWNLKWWLVFGFMCEGIRAACKHAGSEHQQQPRGGEQEEQRWDVITQ